MSDFLAGCVVLIVLMGLLFSIAIPAWDEESAAREAAHAKRLAAMPADVRQAVGGK